MASEEAQAEKAATENKRYRKGKDILEDYSEITRAPYHDFIPPGVESVAISQGPKLDMVKLFAFLGLSHHDLSYYALLDWCKPRGWRPVVNTDAKGKFIDFGAIDSAGKPQVLPDYVLDFVNDKLDAIHQLGISSISDMTSMAETEMKRGLILKEAANDR